MDFDLQNAKFIILIGLLDTDLKAAAKYFIDNANSYGGFPGYETSQWIQTNRSEIAKEFEDIYYDILDESGVDPSGGHGLESHV